MTFLPSINGFKCDSCRAIITPATNETLRTLWFRAWDNGWRAGLDRIHCCGACLKPPEPKPPTKSFSEIMHEVLFEDQPQRSPRS